MESNDVAHETIEDRARALYARAFTQDVDSICVSLIDKVTSQLPEYRYLVETLRDTAFERNLRKHLLHFIDNVQTGSPVRHFGKDHLGYGTAWARAEQGFPLESILRTYQFVTRTIWNWTVTTPQLEGVRPMTMATCWPQWLDYVDAAISATSEAYVAWARRRAEEDHVARRQMLESFLRGDVGAVERERNLVGLGIDSWPSFILVVLRLPPPGNGGTPAATMHQLLARHALPDGTRPLVARRQHGFTVLLPGDLPDSEHVDPVLRIRDVLRDINSMDPDAALYGAVSESVLHHRDIPRAHARTVLAARAAALRREVLRESDLHLLDHALAALEEDYEVLRPASIMKLIDVHTERHPEWIPTMIAWMEAGMNASAAAKRLGVHSNTIYYRLTQIEAHSGLDLRDFSVAFDLYVTARLQTPLDGKSGHP